MNNVSRLAALDSRKWMPSPFGMLKIKPVLRWPLALTGLLMLIALSADLLATHSPDQQDLLNALMGPSAEHWLGTDAQGRDIYSRLLFGLRLDLFAALGAVLLGLVCGTPLGVIAGLVGGPLERVVMQLVNAALSIPPILLIMAVIAILGRDYVHSMIALGVIFSFGYIRVARGEARMIRRSTYVAAARSIGASGARLMLRHVLPGALPALIMQVGLFLPVALLVSASLSYLGLGVQSPQSSLGAMLQAAQEVSLNAPWQVLPPGILLAIAALILSFLAEALSDGLRARSKGTSPLASARGKLSVKKNVDVACAQSVLSVRNLWVEVDDPMTGPRMAVRDVSFTIGKGEVLAVVGESGSGKTLSSMAIVGLLPSSARVSQGAIQVQGRNLIGASPDLLREVRAHEVAVIFQNPMTALSPAHTIGKQLIQPLISLKGMSAQAARDRVLKLLVEVGITDAERRLDQYPHELSGGLAQRVVLAQALARDPVLLIADEATSALDVTVQYQVLELLKKLGKERGLSILFVTHSMGVVAHIADRVAVMYAGEIVESGETRSVLSKPGHPYTAALLNAVPRNVAGKGLPTAPPGSAPRAAMASPGCSFAPRCASATAECLVGTVEMYAATETHELRCLRYPHATASREA